MVTCEFISYKICKLLVTAPLVQWHTSPVHRATTEQLFTNISCLRNEQMPIWRPHYSTGVQQVHIKYCHPNVCFRYKMASLTIRLPPSTSKCEEEEILITNNTTVSDLKNHITKIRGLEDISHRELHLFCDGERLNSREPSLTRFTDKKLDAVAIKHETMLTVEEITTGEMTKYRVGADCPIKAFVTSTINPDFSGDIATISNNGTTVKIDSMTKASQLSSKSTTVSL